MNLWQGPEEGNDHPNQIAIDAFVCDSKKKNKYLSITLKWKVFGYSTKEINSSS